jgi:hypothetical protein
MARRLASFSLLAFAVAQAPLAHANAVVTSCDGPSLQQAVNQGGLVTFACLGNVTLTSTILVSKNTTISGTGHTISGAGSTGIIAVPAGVTLNLDHLNVTNGRANLEGGGVFNRGTLNISHCTFSNNITINVEAGFGGAISNHGTLTVANTLFTSNTALAGGAIYNSGNVTVNSSTFRSNSSQGQAFEGAFGGGAILNDGGELNTGAAANPTLTITNGTFQANSSSTSGGAILNVLGTANIVSSTVSSNTSFGATVENDGGTLTVAGSTFSGNGSSGIFSAPFGDHAPTNTVSNSTFSGNVGGIGFTSGTMNVSFTTLSGNPPQNLLNDGFATLSGTVLHSTSGEPNCFSEEAVFEVTDAGYNLADDGSCGFGTANHSLNNAITGLLSLADNGGPTQTIAPDPASLIIDRIPAGQIGCGTQVTTDQRGVRRPQGKACEVGAYEVTPNVVPSSSSCDGYFTGQFIGNVLVGSTNCTWVGGSITGNLRVTGGTLFLTGVTISGNVEVTGGSIFIGLSTHIVGNLEIHDLPFTSASNQVCGASIDGNMEFHNNTAAISIGADPLSVCAGNAMAGNLVVDNNTAPILILDNTLLRNLDVQNNSAPIQVVGNSVTGGLNCQNNTSITGGPNPGSSKATGDCYQLPFTVPSDQGGNL